MMTLKEAVDWMETLYRLKNGVWLGAYSQALRVVIDAARERLDDTAEIAVPAERKAHTQSSPEA